MTTCIEAFKNHEAAKSDLQAHEERLAKIQAKIRDTQVEAIGVEGQLRASQLRQEAELEPTLVDGAEPDAEIEQAIAALRAKDKKLKANYASLKELSVKYSSAVDRCRALVQTSRTALIGALYADKEAELEAKLLEMVESHLRPLAALHRHLGVVPAKLYLGIEALPSQEGPTHNIQFLRGSALPLIDVSSADAQAHFDRMCSELAAPPPRVESADLLPADDTSAQDEA